MPVVCCAKSCLPHKLGPVGRLNADIFILRLVNFFMGIANGCICAGFHRAHGKEPLTWARWDFTSCSNFRCFFAFPVSGSEAVSIRNLRREGRHASACSNFSVVRSAFRLACVSLLSFASGGSSSAVNSSLEGFSAQRLRLLSAPPVPRLLQPHGNADSIGFRAGVSGFLCSVRPESLFAADVPASKGTGSPGSCPEPCRRASSENGIRPEVSWGKFLCRYITVVISGNRFRSVSFRLLCYFRRGLQRVRLHRKRDRLPMAS